jgi:hypothetical protein
MIKKIVFLVFKNNHRFSALGNFANSTKYDDILLISLGGRFKSIIGKILYFFKIGKFISIDGDPFLKNKNTSINFWLTGTALRISNQYKNYDNNFVNMTNPAIDDEKKVLQLYPIIKKKNQINKNPKLIFMGKIFFKPGNEKLINFDTLKDKKESLLKEFSLIDKSQFWSEINKNQNSLIKFENYKIMKTYLRELILLEINKNFKKYFHLVGEDAKKIGINFSNPTFKIEKIRKIYRGNICMDTGSILGSMSLYPRSIQIIESGGMLIQTKQNDSNKIWGDLEKKIISNNIESLLNTIETNLSDSKTCNENLDMIFEKFKNSKSKIFKNLQESL